MKRTISIIFVGALIAGVGLGLADPVQSTTEESTTDSTTEMPGSGVTNETSTSPAVGEEVTGTPAAAVPVEAPKLKFIHTASSRQAVLETETVTSKTETSTTASTDASPAEGRLKVVEGEPATFSGTTIPNTEVTVTVRSDPKVGTTTSDDDGNWSYTFEDGIDPGVHTVSVAVKNPETEETFATDPVSFEVIPVARTQTSKNVLDEEGGDEKGETDGGLGVFATLMFIAILVILAVALVPLVLKYRKSVEKK